ncbi:MAG: RT0821/Lpp0805 family surface protein, partial [Alphaproteobacteria bacterium]|nr:RT0821/Lpp0805 family surface protein [Alphaproteobacteria bacterium]
HTAPLRNPANDAADMAAALKGFGFAVIEGLDLGREAFEVKLREFARAAQGAEAALFFYAGHGIQVGGENYLLPIDAKLEQELDLDFEALALSTVLRQMRAQANLVFLDACRDNPLARELARSMGASRSAAVGRGLGRMNAASGALIAYATQPGNTAADGADRNSPFTAALLRQLAAPDRSVNDLLTAVTGDVAAATGNRQQPWTHSSLRKPFHFRAPEVKPEPAPVAEAPAKPTVNAERPSHRLTAEQLATERVFWETVKENASEANVKAYLARYPEGAYAILARNLLEQLTGEADAAAQEAAPQQDMAQPPAIGQAMQPEPEDVEASLGLGLVDRRAVQAGLASLGFDPGPADGLFRLKTRAALSAWQEAKGEAATGWLTAVEASALKEAGAEALRVQAEEEQEAKGEAATGWLTAVEASALKEAGAEALRVQAEEEQEAKGEAATGWLTAVEASALEEAFDGSLVVMQLSLVFDRTTVRALHFSDETQAERTLKQTLERGRTGDRAQWENGFTGNSGWVEPTRTWQENSGRYCREFRTGIVLDGEEETAEGYACRHQEGSWLVPINR